VGTWRGRLAWGLCGVTVFAAGIQVVLLISSGGPLLNVENFLVGFPTTEVTAVTGATVGALIVARYPRHPIGWLFAVGACGAGFGLVANALILRQLRGGGLDQGWVDHLAIRVSVLFGSPYTLALGAILFLLVPDGRLPSRRWRPALALPLLGLALHLATVVSLKPERVVPGMVIDNRLGTVTVVLAVATTCAILLALPIAGLALVRRLRTARGEQRQQLRWIATSGVALVAAAIVAIVAVAVSWGGGISWAAQVPLFIAYLSVPLCTGVAILRYRLYDIDVIINRAVALILVAAFVTAGYVAVVLGIGAALGRRVEGRFWPSLLALALVALAFQPVRSRVLRWADRLAYGERAAPYEALADFSRRIGAAASPGELLPLFAEAAGCGVGARWARVHLEVPGTSGLSVSWPDGVEGAEERPDWEVTIADRGEPVGVLSVAMRPGRPGRRDERRLLEGFVEQAGLALRNVRLEAQLRARVAEAAAQSSALEAARRRLLGARDAERQRVAATINHTVLAGLEPLVPVLEPGRRPSPEAMAEELRRLDLATDAALEALRRVTHGLFPAVLTRRGLVPALRAHLANIGAVDVLQVQAPVAQSRFPAATEAAGYFCCLAALAEMARPAGVRLGLCDGLLVIEVIGPANDLGDTAPAPQQAWFVEPALLADRVEAAGGLLRRERSPDGALVVRAELPAPTGSAV